MTKRASVSILAALACLASPASSETGGANAPPTAMGEVQPGVSDTQDPLDALLALEGDMAYGEYLASECTSCHLVTGEASDIPPIVGVGSDMVAIGLYDYREGYRIHPVMQMIASRLGDEEIMSLAAYFASLGE
jgi:cytochrome c